VRVSALLICGMLTACAPSPEPVAPVQRDPTTERRYGETVAELVAMNREANEFFRKGKSDEAAALIEKGEPLSSRLLSVPQPTLAATEAASDLDQLYGQMLLSRKMSPAGNTGCRRPRKRPAASNRRNPPSRNAIVESASELLRSVGGNAT
jgi:hypothetical protein